jgi:hypothetical protein
MLGNFMTSFAGAEPGEDYLAVFGSDVRLGDPNYYDYTSPLPSSCPEIINYPIH